MTKRGKFFADPQTGELLAEHMIEAKHKGKLVTLPRNAERYRETAYEDWYCRDSILCGAHHTHPRYIRDQLSLMSRLQEKYRLPRMRVVQRN